MSYPPYFPYNTDPYDDMDWFPENQCDDVCPSACQTACPMLRPLNCCTTADLCKQIGIVQEPKIGKDGFQVWLDVANFK